MKMQITFLILCLNLSITLSQSIDTAIFTNNNKYILDSDYQDKIVKTGYSFKNTPYRYAGSSKKGMDCSGFVCTSYQSIGVNLPRSSKAIAEKGVYILADDLQPGDLIFFKGYNSSDINHVALVSKITDGLIYIIHATTSKGVIEEVLQHSDYFRERWLFNKRVVE